MSKSFAKILVASDGEQVLVMVVQLETGQRCVQGVTLKPGGMLFVHNLIFDDPEAADSLFEAADLSMADSMRQAVAEQFPKPH